MCMAVYAVFSAALYLWTIRSKQYDTMFPVAGCLLGIVLIFFLVLNVFLFCGNKRIRQGMIMAGVLMNLGMSIYYASWSDPWKLAENPEKVTFFTMLKSIGVVDVILMSGVFLVVSLIICHTKVYRFRAVNLIIMAMLPVIVFGARLTGKATKGSYLEFGGIMIFCILAGWPFVAATFLTMEERRYLNSDVKMPGWNSLLMLGYMGLIFIGSAKANEFGLILVMAVTGSILFFISCKSMRAKLFYSIACMMLAGLAALKVTHIHTRLEAFLDPVGTSNKETAESILYLFRSIPHAGFFGFGIGDGFSRKIIDAVDSDYALDLIILNYSIIVAAMLIILMMLFCKWFFKVQEGLCDYDRYLNLTAALIVITVSLTHVASNLGSFISAGIPLAFVSKAPQINIMFSIFMGMHTGLLGKERFQWSEDVEDTEV